MGKDNALSFVGQIMTAYKAIMKAEGSALEYAIECGKYLALAKENVEEVRPKRKWSAWLKEHCPDIHRNTAALYMRLAQNEDKIAEAECASIRQADVLLRGDNSESDSSTDESHDDEADDVAQCVVQETPASLDLTELLQTLDVDEVCIALTRAWDRQQLDDLFKRLGEHLRTLDKTLDIPAPLKRAPSAPVQPTQ